MPPNRKRFLEGGLASGVLLGAGCASKTGSLPEAASLAQSSIFERARTKLTVDVSAQSDGAIPGASYVGFSWEKEVVGLGTFDAANADLVALFKRLGPSNLRLGGYTVDTNGWDPSGPGRVLGTTSRSDIRRLAGFLAATGWNAYYGVRYKNSDAKTVASEAGAAAEILGSSLAGYEIGNEPDGYTDEAAYAKTWEAYRLAILARVPGASFMAPATAAADRFFKTFAMAETGRVHALSAHHYTGAAKDPGSTVEKLLHSTEDTFLADMLQTQIESNAPAYRVGETNSLYGGGKIGVSDSFASALWAVRYLLDGAKYNASGYNFHGGTSTEFGHELYYSAIRFAGTTGTRVIGVQPIYYGLLLVALAGSGTSYVTTVGGSSDVVAYAIGKNVMTINLGRGSFAATVAMPGAVASARSLLLRTQGGAGATHGQTLGGSTVGLDGSFSPTYVTLPVAGNTFELTIPPLSATLARTT